VKGVPPTLTGSETTFKLESSGVNKGKLPDLSVKLKLIEGHIVNINWQYDDPQSERPVFTNPKDVVNPSTSTWGALENFISIEESPFIMSVKGMTGE